MQSKYTLFIEKYTSKRHNKQCKLYTNIWISQFTILYSYFSLSITALLLINASFIILILNFCVLRKYMFSPPTKMCNVLLLEIVIYKVISLVPMEKIVTFILIWIFSPIYTIENMDLTFKKCNNFKLLHTKIEQ